MSFVDTNVLVYATAMCTFPLSGPSCSCVVRPMAGGDVAAAQVLLSQLGYPLDAREVERRYRAVTGCADHMLWVAERAGRVIALCHAYARSALDKAPEVVVQALVVDQSIRGGGIGKTMMATAEAWARDQGFGSVALASHVARTQAHRFYQALGYRRTATSHLFHKDLG